MKPTPDEWPKPQPEKAEDYMDRAKIYMTDPKHWPRAIEQLKNVVRLEPNNKEAHWFLGGLYQKYTYYAESMHHFEKLMTLHPTVGQQIDANAGLGLIHCKMGIRVRYLEENPKEAKEFYKSLPDLKRRDLLTSGAYFTKAESYFKKVQDLAPDNKSILLELGNLEQARGNFVTAQKYYDDFLSKLTKSDPRYAFRKAIALEAVSLSHELQGNLEKALLVLHDAADCFSRNSQSEEEIAERQKIENRIDVLEAKLLQGVK